MPEELRRRLKAVDPNLTIIPGGVRRHARRTTEAEWEKAAGVICKSCGREVFRSRDGLCMSCWEKENEFEIRDKSGILNLLPKSVILDIVHPSRKEK
ncbi:hypothetical protein ES703_108321 [subsurface metagenome]